MWNLDKITKLCSDEEGLIKFLQDRKLMNNTMTCSKCGWGMKMSNGNWICHKTVKSKKGKRKCRHYVSIKKGTWFEKTKLSYEKVLKLTYFLVYNFEPKTITRELGLNKNTVSQWNTFIKQVLIEYMHKCSEVLGGPNKTVEVHESKFGKRKYNRGRGIQEEWVFGGVEKGSNKLFLVPMENRNLVNIIREWILPGTRVLIDCSKGHINLEEDDFIQLTVNHLINIVNNKAGAHTKTIENLWRHLKNFSPLLSRKKDNFIGYLSHFCFIKDAQLKKKDLFDLILEEISDLTFEQNIDMDT